MRWIEVIISNDDGITRASETTRYYDDLDDDDPAMLHKVLAAAVEKREEEFSIETLAKTVAFLNPYVGGDPLLAEFYALAKKIDARER